MTEQPVIKVERDTLTISIEPLNEEDVGVTSTYVRQALNSHPDLTDLDFTIEAVEREEVKLCPECGSRSIHFAVNDRKGRHEWDCLECGYTAPVEVDELEWYKR